MAKVKAWGNAFHGKINVGTNLVQLANGATHALQNPPTGGFDTRLIEFDSLPDIDLTNQEKTDLLADGLQFQKYAILTDYRLYDQVVGDVWLYRDANARVWKIDVSSAVSQNNGVVTVDITITRFGLFVIKPVLFVAPAPVSFSFSINISTSLTGSDDYSVNQRDFSPDGTGAVFRLQSPAAGNYEIIFIELTASGVIDEINGTGLVINGAEVKGVDQTKSLVDTSETILDLPQPYRIWRSTTIDYSPDIDTFNSPPQSGGPAGGIISASKTVTSTMFDLPESSTPPAGSTALSNVIGHHTTALAKDLKLKIIERALYDNANNLHYYESDYSYKITATSDFSFNPASSSITNVTNVDHHYDGAGDFVNTTVTGDETGSFQATLIDNRNQNYLATLSLLRDGVVQTSVSSGGSWVHSSSKTLDSNYPQTSGFLSGPPGTDTIAEDSFSFNGLIDAVGPAYLPVNLLTNPELRKTLLGLATLASSDAELAQVFKITNNLLQIHTNSKRHELVTPEGNDGIVTDGPNGQPSFNPKTGEVVRPPNGAVFFI